MIASLFVDAGWSCGQLVVKAIEQDALASRNQALHVRSPEVEVPDFWIFQLIVPVADAGKRRIHDHPSRYPRRIERRKRVADHVADVVGDESKILNAEFVQNVGEVARLSGLFVAAILMR